jgi:alginate O-acetyltransferase complex protein AlgJ
MSKAKYFLVVFFCVLITLPLVGDLVEAPVVSRLDENRYVETGIGMGWKDRVSTYVKSFDSKFWGRDYLLKAFIILKKDLFGVSPLPEKVVFGKSDWLYLADYGTIDDYRNLRPFSPQQLDSIQSYLSHISAALAARNKKFYVVVVPDKHTIYPEFLPPNIQKLNAGSRLQQLRKHLHGSGDIRFIDLSDTLIQAKKIGQVYLKQESHWNDLGTFAGYQYIMRRIKSDFPDVKILSREDCQIFEGKETDIDLMKLLGEDVHYAENSLKIVPWLQNSIETASSDIFIPAGKRLNPSYAFRKINSQVKGHSVIVFRDSYFSSLVPFFEQSFQASSYIWTSDVDLDYTLNQKADIVLLEIAERNLYLITH